MSYENIIRQATDELKGKQAEDLEKIKKHDEETVEWAKRNLEFINDIVSVHLKEAVDGLKKEDISSTISEGSRAFEKTITLSIDQGTKHTFEVMAPERGSKYSSIMVIARTPNLNSGLWENPIHDWNESELKTKLSNFLHTALTYNG